MKSPGTYRIADGVGVDYFFAIATWAEAARPALVDTAKTYNGVITYSELGESVQDRSGIRTRMLLMNWIGPVLAQVGEECCRRGERLLTALCVHQDGTVGDGYAEAVLAAEGSVPPDAELHAAEERLAWYRLMATDLPADGGQPMLTRQELSRRKAAAITRAALAPAPVCSICNITLPATGRCDDHG